MDNYSEYIRKAGNIIDDAMRSMNFAGLGNSINANFRDAMDDEIWLSDEAKSYQKVRMEKERERAERREQAKQYRAHQAYNSEQQSRAGQTYTAQPNAQQNMQKPEYPKWANADYTYPNIPIAKSPSGKISGIVLIILGIAGVAIFGGNLIFSIGMSQIGFWGMNSVPALLLGCTVASGGMIALGVNYRHRLKRFRAYLAAMKNDEFCEIKQIAEDTNIPLKQTSKDLNKMIKLRMFPEGHIDSTGKWFMGNNDMYRRYKEARDNALEQEEIKAAEERERAGETDSERTLREVLEKGADSIRQIREANDDIPGEEISKQLDEIEHLIDRIFKRVEEKPELLDDIRRFMDYYLPTTLKLVGVYRELENEGLKSEEAVKARRDIEETLETIEQAFERLLSELYKDTVMDVNADISVLKTMFAKDGLTGDDFKIGGNG